ncbi:MAG: 50S ribosomal protein L11 methyltransferase [Deltaproteobacteria bacterium]|nr:50S ribosomal protein L11 methyltransferase [Deltaproteobacteria bacterium]
MARRGAELAELGRLLARAGLTPEKVLTFTGAVSLGDLSRAIDDTGRRASKLPRPRGLGALIALLCCGLPQLVTELENLLGAPALALLEAVGVLERVGAELSPRLALVPAQRRLGPREGRGVGPVVLIAHDLHRLRFESLAVMAPDLSSELILRASAARADSWLDVGTGSGLVALAAALRGTPRVIAADLNPRVPPFVRLGAALNGVAGAVTALESDLMHAVPPGSHDVITFNSPLLFGMGDLLWRNTAEGPALLRRFFDDLAPRLAGEALIHAQLPHDERVLPARVPMSEPGRFHGLSLRYELGEEWAQGLLWLAPARGGRALWVEELHEPTPEQLFLDREQLELALARNEMRSPLAT